MWPRARRFGNVYAFASVDGLYTVLWFTAWICVASYVAQGKAIGKHPDDKDKDKNKGDNNNNNGKRDDNKDNSDKKGGCDAWAYGHASKCNISTATVILGVVILYVF